LNLILSHFRAGSGALLVETREESRLLRQLLADLPEIADVCTIAAPSGPVRDARTGRVEKDTGGLQAGYAWASEAPGRVLVAYDWHMLCNNAGHWRALAEALPRLRSPRGSKKGDPASLVVYCAPHWDLQPQNPLRGLLPVLQFDLPDRESLRAAAEALRPLPAGPEADQIVDALCGLSADAAEQASAEVLARCDRWDASALRDARRQMLRDGGLELWPTVSELGGLAGLQTYADSEILPWIRDPQLSVRRILCAGVPGVGKSYCARWLAHKLSCECARLSIPALKAGIVGASEANLRRALRTLDALGKYSPLVVVLDEVDTIAREGLDGGTSSGMFAELLTWLQESTSQTVVVATLNRLDKLDAALESRFQARFFFDLPCARERIGVAKIHYRRLGCQEPDRAAESTGQLTEGFSSRELAEHVCPSVCRLSRRNPDTDLIRSVVQGITPASRTQAEQLAAMRRAAATLRRANDPEVTDTPTGRRVRPN